MPYSFEFVAPLSRQESAIGWFSIIYIPEKYNVILRNEKNLRAEVTFGNLSTAHISIKKKEDYFFLVVNNDHRKKLGVDDGDPVEVHVREEVSQYGMPMPEELSLMFDEYDRSWEYFDALSPGKQRSLIYLVAKMKNVDPRIRKAQAIAEHLLECQGELDFRALNEKIKEVNQRNQMR